MHTDEIENRNATWVNHWPREKALANVALYAYSKSKILVIVQMTSDLGAKCFGEKTNASGNMEFELSLTILNSASLCYVT